MVTFEHAPEHRRLLDDYRQFLEEEVTPLQEKYQHVFDDEHAFIQPDGTFNPELLEVGQRVRLMSAKRGFYGMAMPEEVGGLGVPLTVYLAAAKEAFRHGIAFHFGTLAGIEGPSRMHLAMDEAQRETYLAPLMRAEKSTCFALTEPGAGSDVKNIETTAVQDGDDYVLNGTKLYVTNGMYSDFAVVFAKTDPDPAAGYGGITAFIVEKGTPGFEVVGMHHTIANNGLPTRFEFKDCRVPEANVMGGEGAGFLHALQSIGDTRIYIGALSIGLAEYCLARATDYVREREAFGRPIGKYQGVSFQLADARTELTMVDALAQYTAWRVDQGEDAIAETSMLKLRGTEMLWDVADKSIQVMGAVGTLRESRVERILRFARVFRIFEGTSEIQRNTIAKTMGL